MQWLSYFRALSTKIFGVPPRVCEALSFSSFVRCSFRMNDIPKPRVGAASGLVRRHGLGSVHGLGLCEGSSRLESLWLKDS
ncbi:hypothetical protein CSUI_006162 [Cystoisospora suis]|uniref:Uncharacterized protein n=1 Tax=Cystoisospora suis TaxID=483139 RepID=A0A2C6KVD2_9APIC|nr:hypothetical protein CSUI_006162 [Cystoisospora suis]